MYNYYSLIAKTTFGCKIVDQCPLTEANLLSEPFLQITEHEVICLECPLIDSRTVHARDNLVVLVSWNVLGQTVCEEWRDATSVREMCREFCYQRFKTQVLLLRDSSYKIDSSSFGH